MDAVIYIRWSSAEQGKGSSLERQREDCRRHAADKGWNVVAELIDDGMSAFRGRHATAGALARFVADVEDGGYPDGVVLLTEKLDRLSREEPGRVFVWMMRVTEAGVVIATVEGGRQYRSGNFDMAGIIEVVVKAQLAHEESQKKSQRIGAAWSSKRARLAQGDRTVMTRRTPAWLTVVGQPPHFEVIEERAAVIRRIYEETAAGFGKHHIARNLNRDGVATFGRAGGWHASYVQKILNSGAVLGEFQPGRKPRGEQRTAAGDPVSDYYPRIVDADLHARARTSMAGRARQVAGRGRRLANIFSGLAKCSDCGSRMTFRSKGRKIRASGEAVREDYLICDSYQRGRGCSNSTHFNYAAWEMAILNAILIKALGDRHFRSSQDVRTLEIKLAEKQRSREGEIRKQETALDLLLETNREDVKARWLAASVAVDDLDGEIEALRRILLDARGVVSPEEHLQRIHDLVGRMEDHDEDVRFEARSRVMAAVHDLTSEMRMCPQGPVVDLLRRDGLAIRIEQVGGAGPEAEFFYTYDPGFFD